MILPEEENPIPNFRLPWHHSYIERIQEINLSGHNGYTGCQRIYNRCELYYLGFFFISVMLKILLKRN